MWRHTQTPQQILWMDNKIPIIYKFIWSWPLCRRAVNLIFQIDLSNRFIWHTSMQMHCHAPNNAWFMRAIEYVINFREIKTKIEMLFVLFLSSFERDTIVLWATCLISWMRLWDIVLFGEQNFGLFWNFINCFGISLFRSVSCLINIYICNALTHCCIRISIILPALTSVDLSWILCKNHSKRQYRATEQWTLHIVLVSTNLNC